MRTFGDLLSPGAVGRLALVRDGVLILAGTMLVAVCAKIQIPGTGTVPITLQTFAVVLVGATLGARRGALSLSAYLFEGAVGMPVFAGPIAGAAYFAGPTTGYLVGFVLAAFVVGRLAERGWDRRFAAAICMFAVGHLLILALGGMWLAGQVGLRLAITHGVLVFLPGAAWKMTLAAALLPSAWKCVHGLDRSGGI